MSITMIQLAALDDLDLPAQSAMETAWAAFQAADQALTLAQFTGISTTIPTTTRTAALAALKVLAAALT